MRYLIVLILVFTSLGEFHAGSGEKQARQRLLKGNYAEARILFQGLLKKEEKESQAAIGLCRSWCREGEYEKALAVLNKVLEDHSREADLLAEKADLLFFRGRWEEAEKAAREALKENEEQYRAHWVLARLYRDRGELTKFDEELLWFIRNYVQHSRAGKDITDSESLLLIGLAAVERARLDSRLQDQFGFVLREVWGYAAKQDPDFWWAKYHMGALFQEKYDYEKAFRYFTEALVINSRAAEVFTSKGEFSLSRYDMNEAELFMDQALKINPHLPAALRLKADFFLTGGDFKQAREYLDKARKINPRSEATLARIAVCHFLNHEEDEFEKVVAQVEKQNPRCALFYYDLAKRLDDRKRYLEAEKFYKKSLFLRPRLVAPRHQLGLLYMRLGKEKEAYKLLDKSFKADPFNVRVFNMLKVLDHLEKYDTLLTPHFEIRYDSKNDKILVNFMAKYLEEIYEELAEQFQYRPKERILIEVFNKHEMFSGRVIALPDLHTIGACTGKVIALVSPRDKSGIVSKPFNWNRVLRHELVHIFNLEQTKFQVPHWFTEGLAVRAEKMAMPPLWNKLLLKRVESGELRTLVDIHLGFIRPGSSEEWNLAYLQSMLYVDYLIHAHGQKAVAGMLDAYREGLPTRAALEKVCQISQDEFEKTYRQYLQELAQKIGGKVPEKRLTFNELRVRWAKDNQDADVAAALAEQYLFFGNRDSAGEWADKALNLQANQPLASYVKAKLLLADKKSEEAQTLLEKVLDKKTPHPKVAKLLGSVHFEAKEFSKAAEMFELGRQANPYDIYWLIQLVRCYQQNGADAKLVDVLKDLVPIQADDLSIRRELAELLLEAGNHAEAEKYAWKALEIDVMDQDARNVLQEALKAQNKEESLREFEKLLER